MYCSVLYHFHLLLFSCFCLSVLPPREQLHSNYQQDGAGGSQTLHCACKYLKKKKHFTINLLMFHLYVTQHLLKL